MNFDTQYPRNFFPALLISLPLFFILTNPHSIPIPFLIMPFVLFFSVLFFSGMTVLNKTSREYSSRKKAAIAVLVAAAPTLLLILQSIHQLSLQDVLLVAGLLITLGFYLYKQDIFA
jgi:cation transport ATPase